MITIGITGSIGMGKSTVARMLYEKKVPVHIADEAVHRLMAFGGRAVEPVGKLFPRAVKKDIIGRASIDRAILGEALFDTKILTKLQDILHPLVFEDAISFREEAEKAGYSLIAFDIPLLFETGAEKRVDVTVCVSAPYEVQRARVMLRPNMTTEKFEQILKRQMPDSEKRQRADHVIENDGDLTHLRKQVNALIDLYKNKG